MKSIVIIGGGYVGSAMAQELSRRLLKKKQQVKITILEKQSFVFHAIAAARALVEPSIIPKLCIPLSNAFASNSLVSVVQAQAESISERSVRYRKVVNDQLDTELYTIEFDYLVIATGSAYTSPIKPQPDLLGRAATEKGFITVQKKLKTAQRILIVGGGAVGVEVAGEIAAKYPGKKIQLLDGNNELIARQNLNPKFRKKLLATLESMGVEVILGQRLKTRLTESSFTPQDVETTSGKVLQSDIQLLCAGSRPNTSIIESLNPSLLTDRGLIRVLPTFQLTSQNHAHIFALGDANDHPTPKMAYWGGLQASHLAKSLSEHILKKANFRPFAGPSTEAIMVPLGPHNGVSQLPLFGGIVVGSRMTKLIKGKDLFVTQFFKQFGATVP